MSIVRRLAKLAGAQITATLFCMSLYSAAGITIPRIFGFFCIFLNVITLPLVIYFNVRRLKRRKDILAAFLIEHEVEGKVAGGPTMRHSNGLGDYFDPSYFREYWNAGHRSEHEVFCATLEWIDAALERPVSRDRWAQILFTLEQLPLETSANNADVRHGARGSITLPMRCPLLAREHPL